MIRAPHPVATSIIVGLCLALPACNTIRLSADRSYVSRAEPIPPSIRLNEDGRKTLAELNAKRGAEGHIIYIENNGKKPVELSSITLFFQQDASPAVPLAAGRSITVQVGRSISLPVPGSTDQPQACLVPSHLTAQATSSRKRQFVEVPIAGGIGVGQFRDMRQENCPV